MDKIEWIIVTAIVVIALFAVWNTSTQMALQNECERLGYAEVVWLMNGDKYCVGKIGESAIELIE